MKGIFSSTPGTGPIRLLVGTHGLMLTQSVLALLAPGIEQSFRVLVLLVLLLAIGGFTAAALGLPAEGETPSWGHRHGL